MSYVRRHHLAIAGLLFLAAIVLYALGLVFEATVAFALGGFVELAAWYSLSHSLFNRRPKGAPPPAKQ